MAAQLISKIKLESGTYTLEDGIVFIHVTTDFVGEEAAQEMLDMQKKLWKKTKRKLTLVDLNVFSKISVRARKILKATPIEKAALVVTNPVHRILGAIFIKINGMATVRMFNSIESAKKWLLAD